MCIGNATARHGSYYGKRNDLPHYMAVHLHLYVWTKLVVSPESGFFFFFFLFSAYFCVYAQANRLCCNLGKLTRAWAVETSSHSVPRSQLFLQGAISQLHKPLSLDHHHHTLDAEHVHVMWEKIKYVIKCCSRCQLLPAISGYWLNRTKKNSQAFAINKFNRRGEKSICFI